LVSHIASSYFVEVLGGENVDLEMPKILGMIWRNSVKPFPEQRG
jgi:hypothetical protein